MTFFQISSILITLAAIFSVVNHKLIRLPTTIGIMLLSLAASSGLVVLGRYQPGIHARAVEMAGAIDFREAVLHGMLALLLFAGSIHLDINDLRKEQGIIAILSLGGTVLSAFMVAGLSYLAFHALNFPVRFIECMLFGALISPTDPIAVLGIMKRVNAPRALETQLSGESLFNDGVGVVIFLTVLDIAIAGKMPSAGGLTLLLLRQIAGGVALGLTAGLATYYLIKSVENYSVEILLTLALATGGFALGDLLHVSAPIAIVVAGLFIGNHGRSFGMSPLTREHLDTFWELIDDIANAVLFLMIGLQLLVMPLAISLLWAGVAATAIALAVRWISVALSVASIRPWRKPVRGTITLLTWGGLRGGLSVAMALALPAGPHRDLLLAATYSVVVFSVFAQGLSLAGVVKKVQMRSGVKSE